MIVICAASNTHTHKARRGEKCSPTMEEKFLWKGKLKGDLKQKQDESLSFWKEHSETMVLNETQFLTKIFCVLQGLLLCCVYQELCFIFPKIVCFILCTVPLCASPPYLLRFKSAIVVLYLWSALKIWKDLSLQDKKTKAFRCDSDRSCWSPRGAISPLWRPRILPRTNCHSCLLCVFV